MKFIRAFQPLSDASIDAILDTQEDSEPFTERDGDGYVFNGFDDVMCVTVQRHIIVRDHSYVGPRKNRIGQDVRSLYNGGPVKGSHGELFDAQLVLL